MRLPVVLYPDPRLMTKSRPVVHFDAALKSLAADMIETMRESEGIGLAAVQVGELLRLMTMDERFDREDKGEARVLVNPVIQEAVGTESCEEGCLSLPEIREVVERAARVRVKAQDLDGKERVLEYEGILARCIQHEIDHMDGKLFVMKVPAVKRILLKPRLKELERRFKAEEANLPRKRQGASR